MSRISIHGGRNVGWGKGTTGKRTVWAYTEAVSTAPLGGRQWGHGRRGVRAPFGSGWRLFSCKLILNREDKEQEETSISFTAKLTAITAYRGRTMEEKIMFKKNEYISCINTINTRLWRHDQWKRLSWDAISPEDSANPKESFETGMTLYRCPQLGNGTGPLYPTQIHPWAGSLQECSATGYRSSLNGGDRCKEWTGRTIFQQQSQHWGNKASIPKGVSGQHSTAPTTATDTLKGVRYRRVRWWLMV